MGHRGARGNRVTAKAIPLSTVIDSLLHPSDTQDSVIITDLRVPRTILGLLGVNAGAAAADLHEQGRTLVMVLHDLNQACRYATRILAMRDGVLVAEGAPGDVVDAELVRDVFGLECRVIPDPETGTPLVVPAARRAVAAAPVT